VALQGHCSDKPLEAGAMRLAHAGAERGRPLNCRESEFCDLRLYRILTADCAVTLDHTDHRCRDTCAVHQSGFSTLLCEVGQPHCKALSEVVRNDK